LMLGPFRYDVRPIFSQVMILSQLQNLETLAEDLRQELRRDIPARLQGQLQRRLSRLEARIQERYRIEDASLPSLSPGYVVARETLSDGSTGLVFKVATGAFGAALSRLQMMDDPPPIVFRSTIFGWVPGAYNKPFDFNELARMERTLPRKEFEE